MNPSATISNEQHKLLAISCYNAVWEILEKQNPNEAEKREALALAYTSTWHWKQVGTLLNQQRGEWIISRVCVTFGWYEQALIHAKLCLQLTEELKMEDFDKGYGYEAIARVYKHTKQENLFQEYLQKAKNVLEEIINEEDKEIYLKDIMSLEEK